MDLNRFFVLVILRPFRPRFVFSHSEVFPGFCDPCLVKKNLLRDVIDTSILPFEDTACYFALSAFPFRCSKSHLQRLALPFPFSKLACMRRELASIFCPLAIWYYANLRTDEVVPPSPAIPDGFQSSASTSSFSSF
eukprot:TRINITY_DN38709_c0_g1_i1.p1 TRINITY_DN38709_c0_g1~~TRINITY_DN38709_c0_g1_i1.p1  ORF type:complete len:136 (-),score=5.06 TRINITY_DN38709_c0_g1_i1:295-702(-)